MITTLTTNQGNKMIAFLHSFNSQQENRSYPLIRNIMYALSYRIALFVIAMCLLIVPGIARADNPYLVKDINTVNQSRSSNPVNFTGVNGTVYFTAITTAGGLALWKTDGTDPGTVIVPGTSKSNPQLLNKLGNNLYFIAGQNLMISDGASAASIVTTFSEYPYAMLSANNKLYIATLGNGFTTLSLWVYDTVNGTQLITNALYPDYHDYVSNLTFTNNYLYFIAGDSSHNPVLYQSDGTAGGTTILKSGWWWLDSIRAAANGSVYFLGNDSSGDALWTSDGTPSGTTVVKYVTEAWNYHTSLTVAYPGLFFIAQDGGNGYVLWQSDLTSAGTTTLPLSNNSHPFAIATSSTSANDDRVLIASFDGISGSQIWSYRSSIGTPTLLQNISFNISTPAIQNLMSAGNVFYFSADAFDSSTGYYSGQELWKCSWEGYLHMPERVKDIRPGYVGSNPANLTYFNGVLYLSADDGVSGNQVWKSYGNLSDTFLLKALEPPMTASSIPSSLTNVNGTLFFAADDGLQMDAELWESDGTAAGTSIVKTIGPSAVRVAPNKLTNVNGTLFFTARQEGSGVELWKSDGTGTNTVLVKDINPGNADSSVNNLTDVGGTLYFTATDGVNGIQLWKSDGSFANTVAVSDVNSSTTITNPTNLVAVGGALFCISDDGSGLSLWVTDGINVTKLISGGNPRNLTNVNGVLMFISDGGANLTGTLWRSDGTQPGTSMVYDLSQVDIDPVNLMSSDGKLYFGMHLQSQLWKSDGTAGGTSMVVDMSPSSIVNLTDVNGTLFFASNGLWKTDGTAGGTVLLKPSSPIFMPMVNGNGTLFFKPEDDMGLWRSDGTSSGTVKVTSSTPFSFAVIGNTLFFATSDYSHGLELFAYSIGISINGNQNTTAAKTTQLTLACPLPNDCTQMLIGADPGLAGAQFVSYATTTTWQLTGGDGTKMVCVQYKDTVGNLSQVYCDTIALDTTPPDTFLTVNSPVSSPTTTNAAQFTFTANEPGTFECLLDFDAAGYQPCTSPTSYTLYQGSHIFRVRAIDSAGNIASTPATYSWTIIDNLGGSAFGWGGNSYGQLGIGSSDYNAHPLAAPVNGPVGFVQIAAGYLHTVALRNDGTVWAWGSNVYHQLARPNTAEILAEPTQVSGINNVRTIIAGYYYTFALRTDGTIWGWGKFGSDATKSTPEQILGIDQVTAISAGVHHVLALRQDGTVWTWGQDEVGELGQGISGFYQTYPTIIPGLFGITAVAAGQNHSLAIRGSDNRVLAWGGGFYGELGTEASSDKLVPNPVSLSNGAFSAVKIAAGRYSSIAVDNIGNYWGWGLNENGKLGLGLVFLGGTTAPTMGTIPGNAVVDVALGADNVMFLTDGGTVWISGKNDFGQIGRGLFDNDIHPLPEKVGYMSGVYHIANGSDGAQSFALRTTWISTVLDASANISGHTSLAIDRNATVHISDASVTALGYMTNAGGSWQKELIPSLGTSVLSTGTAVDSNGKVHMCAAVYNNSNAWQVYYLTNKNGFWLTANVDNGAADSPVASCSIAMKDDATVYISYYAQDSTNNCGRLRLASLTAGGGDLAINDLDNGLCTPGVNVGRYSSIAVDSLGNAHVSYADSNATGLKYTGGTVVPFSFSAPIYIDSAAVPSDVGTWTSIALFNDKPAVSYTYGRYVNFAWEYSVKFARYNGSAWDLETVDATDKKMGLYGTSLANLSGVPYVSYYDDVNGDLKVANWTCTGCSWARTAVDTDGRVGKYSAIAVDSLNGLHVSYWDDTVTPPRSALKYATNVDAVRPGGIITINNGAEFTNNPVVNLNLTCDDGFGIGCWEVALSNDGIFNIERAVPFATSMLYTFLVSEGTQTVYAQYRDGANNWSMAYSASIIIDTQKPVGGSPAIRINSGAQNTNTQNVNLALSASDLYLSQMMVSNDPNFVDAFAEPYRTSRAWLLLPGDGAKTVYVKFGDRAGNWSDRYEAPISIDQAMPVTGAVKINDGDLITNNRTATLTLTCDDGAGSGCSTMQFSNDNALWSTPAAFAGSATWTLTTVDETKTVYARFTDAAGNMTQYSISANILLDTTPTTGTIKINGGAKYTNTPVVNIDLSCTDTGSGCSQMRFSNDGKTWTDPIVVSSTTSSYVLDDGQNPGALWAWGNNASGQIGIGTNSGLSIPTMIGPSDKWSALSDGPNYTLAVRTDGTLWSWGDNTFCQLGLGDSYACDASGNMMYPVQVGMDTDWATPVAGPSHALALKKDGTLWVWGDNATGQLGINQEGGRVNIPQPVYGGGTWRSIAAGADFSLGIKTDGTMWAWGNNYGNGTLGIGWWNYIYLACTWENSGWGPCPPNYVTVPIQAAGGMDWDIVSAANVYAMATKTDGTLWAWGNGAASPDQIGTETNWAKPIAGVNQANALKTNGDLWSWGSNPIIYIPSWYSFWHYAGDEVVNAPDPVMPGSTWISVSAGSAHTAGIQSDGGLWTWGVNDYGVLGCGDTCGSTDTPRQVASNFPNKWKFVSAGSGFTSAIRFSDTKTVYVEYQDLIGNWSQPYMSSIILDQEPPTGSVIVSPGAIYSTVNLAVSCTDPVSGCDKMCVSNTPSCTSWENYAATKKDVALVSAPTMSVYVWFRDMAGNETPASTPFIGTIHDTVAPTGTIKINNNAPYTATTAVSLDLSCADNGSGCVNMRFSNDGGAWTYPTSMNSAMTFTLDTNPGILWTWGNNARGQLGIGTNLNNSTPTRVGENSLWLAASSGSNYMLAVRSDGTLWAWGDNTYCQLGLGDSYSCDSSSYVSSPVQVGTDADWAMPVAGISHSLAVKKDGTLWTWGNNEKGQLGVNQDGGFANTPREVYGGGTWRSAAAGIDFSVGIKMDGTIWTWGNNYANGTLGMGGWYEIFPGSYSYAIYQVNVPTLLDSCKDVSAGARYVMCISTDGSLRAWGNGVAGPLQVGTDTDWSVPIAGVNQALALKNDGSLWTWGANPVVTSISIAEHVINTPVRLSPGSTWTLVSEGQAHTAGIQSDGSLWTWGTNASGELGCGDGCSAADEPRQISTNFPNIWMSASAGVEFTSAIRHTEVKTVYVEYQDAFGNWSQPVSKNIALDQEPPIGSVVISQGMNYSTVNLAISCKDAVSGCDKMCVSNTLSCQSWEDLAATKNDVVLITAPTMTVYVWFRDKAGNETPASSPIIGTIHDALAPTGTIKINNNAQYTTTPSVTLDFSCSDGGSGCVNMRFSNDGGTWTDPMPVSSSLTYTLGDKPESPGTLWTWGNNANGQLGIGSNKNRNTLDMTGLDEQWSVLSNGSNYMLAVRSDGTLWAWGDNSICQLGLGDSYTCDASSYVTTPVQVGTDTDWTTPVAGESHSFALKKDGTLWAWGNNATGQLGINQNGGVVNAPQQIFGGGAWKTATSGHDFSVGIKTDGTLWIWGNNPPNGYLYCPFAGNPSTWWMCNPVPPTPLLSPTLLDANNDWDRVSASNEYAMAVKLNGSLWAWGNLTPAPVQVSSETDWSLPVAGLSQALALKKDGSLWSWGATIIQQSPAFGQYYGTATVAPSQQLATGMTWSSVSAGSAHIVGIQTDGSLWAWGTNDFGDLGCGDLCASTDTPRQIASNFPNKWKAIYAGAGFTSAIRHTGTKTVYVEYQDAFGNWSQPVSKKIILDQEPPTGMVKINNSDPYTVSPIVSLTVSCTDQVSGCDKMCISSTPGSCLVWEDVASTKNNVVLQSNPTTTVYVWFSDIAGNTTSSPATASIIYDNAGPSVSLFSINNTALYANNAHVKLSISAADPNGVSMMFSNDNAHWSPLVPFAPSVDWNLNDLNYGGLAGDGGATVFAKFIDNAGNETASSSTITLDTKAPDTTSVAFSALTTFATTSSVSLVLNCGDATTTCTQMQFSNDGMTWSNPLAYAINPTWNLNDALFGGNSADGNKTIFVKFKDAADNWTTGIISKSIILDTVLPIGSLSINNLVTEVSTSNVTLSVNCSDATSGCSQMQFSNFSNGPWSTLTAYSGSALWNINDSNYGGSPIDGPKIVYAVYKDAAGNLSTALSTTVTMDSTPPVTTASPNGGSFNAPQGVTLICNDGAGVGCGPTYYSMDGNDPGILYTGSITISQPTTLRYKSRDLLNNIELASSATFSFVANYTTLSLELSQPTVDYNGSITAWGRLQNMTANLADPSGQTIALLVTSPSGSQTTLTTTVYDPLGYYIVNDVAGFTNKGAYSIQATFTGSSLLSASASDAKPLLVGSSAGYAVIVEGKIPTQEGLDSHNKTANRIYQKLKSRGFVDDNIYYFNYLNQTGVDAAPSKAQIQYAIEEWAKGRMNGLPAPLYVIMVDHGSPDQFHIDNEVITPDDLNAWISNLESGLNAQALLEKRVVIMGFCYSGSFIQTLSSAPTVTNGGRVLVTSAAPDEVSYKGPQESDGIRSGEFFLEEFFTQLERGYTIREAFVSSTDKTKAFTQKGGSANALPPYYDGAVQHPMLDDNGDGKGTNSLSDDPQADGAAAQTLQLGVGANYNVNSIQFPVDLMQVTDTITLTSAPTDTTALLWATVTDDSQVDSAVWIEVRSPSLILNSSAGSIQADLNTTKVPMVHNGTTNRWEVSASLFDQSGEYEIFYFVRDKETLKLSPMKRSIVYKEQAGNSAPGAFSLVAPSDASIQTTVLVFDWADSVDPDGNPITYTVQLSTSPTFTPMAYQKAGLTDSNLAIGSEAGLKDKATYYWKVLALDTFGAITESNNGAAWSFQTDNPNSLPGIIKGYVTDSATGIALSGASVVSSTGGTVTTATNGAYVISIPSGATTISATASGYVSSTGVALTIASGENQTRNIQLDPSQYTLTVNLVGGGTGTVTSTPAGISCGSSCTSPYANGSLIDLNAVPASGSQFNGWTGGGCSGTGVCQVTLTTSKLVSANFSTNMPLITISGGAGGTISPTGSLSVAYGTNQPFTVTPNAGYSAAVSGTCGGSLVATTFTTNPIVGPCTVTASFTPILYTVTPSAGTGGSISPSLPQTMNYNAVVSFAATANAGYSLASVNGCSGSLIGNMFTTGAITSDCTVTASFTLNSYAVTPSSVGNGSMFPTIPQMVSYNGTTSFSVMPSTGYHVSAATGCGGSLTGTTYTTGNIVSNCTVTTTYATDTFTVSPSAGPNGSISPNSAQSIDYNQGTNFTITPLAGYHIALVSGCSGTLTGTSYSTGPITADCTVSASFAIDTISVTPAAAANGILSPNTPQTVNYNGAISFLVIPDTGYHTTDVSGCNGTLNGNLYTTGGIISPCTITASFATDTYTVTPAAGAGGAMTPNFAQIMSYGTFTSFTIVPDAGQHIASAFGCNGALSGSVYTTGSIVSNCTVTTTYATDTFTVSPSAGPNGTISPNNAQSINYNQGTSFTLAPLAGYHIALVSGCSGTLTGTTYATGPITANCAVNASFAIDTINVTPAAAANGAMSPNVVQAVNYNGTASFLIIPDPGYHITGVSGCSGSQNGNLYTTSGITAPCTVTPSFAIDTYNVSPSAGAGGTISPNTPQSVNYNTTTSFTINTGIGYHIALVSGCSGTLSGNSYTTGPITAPCAVNATFASDTFSVDPTTDGNGMISPNTTQTVNYNTTKSFTLTPNAGNHISLANGCSGTLSGSIYTTGTITADCVISASFTNDPPSIPVLSEPMSGGTVTTMNPVLAINASIDPDGDVVTYTYEVYADIGGSIRVAYATGQGTSWTVNPALADNTTYYWRAQASDGYKNSGWMTSSDFFINTANDSPTSPGISAPVATSHVGTLSPTLSVTNGNDVDKFDVLTYDFDVATDIGFGTPVASVISRPQGTAGVTSWTTPALGEDTTYYWRSRSVDNHGAASAWAISTFFVNIANNAPGSPTALSPLSGANVAIFTPILTIANASDPEGDVLTYTFEIASDLTFSTSKQSSGQVVQGAGNTLWAPAALTEDTTYYWHARAYDGLAYGPWIATQSFFVNTINEAPGAPTLNNPADNGQVNSLSPTLTVNAAVDPDNDSLTYEFEVYADSGLTSQVTATYGAGTVWSITPNLSDYTRYWWRSRAKDTHNAIGPWNAAASFFVNNTGLNDPPSITITAPNATGEITNALNYTIRWIAADRDSNPLITLYYDTVSSNCSGTQIATGIHMSDPGSSYNWDISALLDGTYYLCAKIEDEVTTITAPAVGTLTINRTSPLVTVNGTPPGLTSQTTALLTVSGNGFATYQYRVDGGSWSTDIDFATPIALSSLSDGPHTVAVQGKDNIGNVQSVPTTVGWTVDTQAPDTMLQTWPSLLSHTTSAAFTFTSEALATFTCRLDNGLYGSCTSPRSFTGLAEGSHTFEVRAADQAGNIDPIPASSTWIVDTSRTVTPTSGTNGAISPNVPQIVTYGTAVSLTITPDIGYHINLVTGCSGTLSNAIYTTSPILSDCSVIAGFAPDSFTLTPSAGAGGSINPAVPQSAAYNSTTTFAITPGTGYHIDLVSGCSGTLSGNTYTTGPAQNDCTISATFAVDMLSVTPSSGGNGGINPATPQTVIYNGTTSFTVTPSTGYHIATATGCGGSLLGSTYTTGNIVSNCTVTTTYAVDTYTVIPTAGTGGSVSPGIPQTVLYNTTTSFTLNPATGYHLNTVNGCSGSLLGNVYTIGPAAADCQVNATFTTDSFTVTPNSVPNGGLSPDTPQTMSYGSSMTLVVVPGTGYHIASVSGCSGSLNGNLYSTGTISAPCAVTPIFAIDTFTVSATANANGSISPTIPQVVSYNTTTIFTILPDAGYHILSIAGCSGTLSGNTYTAGPIIADCSLSVDFAADVQNTFQVTPSAGPGGAVGPNSAQLVSSGTSTSFLISPLTGYHIASVTGCGGSLSNTTYTTGAIYASCEVNALFAPDVFVVSPSSDTNGAINPKTAQSVVYNTATSFVLVPNAGYHLASINGCSGLLTGNVYTTGTITTNCNVAATFSVDSFTITPTATIGGSINPNTPQTVNFGVTSSFTITPAAGYKTQSVTGCGGSLSGNTYTTGPTASLCTVQATFVPDTYQVIPQAGAGGTIFPSAGLVVSAGSTTSFTISPLIGSHVSYVTGCNGSLSGSTYTTGAINANCQVSAFFAQDTFAVSPVAGANGGISPATAQTIDYNATEVFSLNPNPGYHVASVSGCNGMLAGNTYTTGAITANCSVTATFAINTFIVSTTLDANGNITPATDQTVNYNATASFTLTPNTGYHIASVTGCNGSLVGNTFITGAITSNCTVNAIFANDTFVMAPVAGTGGAISPNTPQNVSSGTTASFQVLPAVGYHVDTVTGCNGTLNGNVYTTGTAAANCSVNAVFAMNTFTVTPSAGPNGSSSPNTPQNVSANASTSFTLLPNVGYQIDTVTGCNGSLSGNTYTTGAITGACTVTATFTAALSDGHLITDSVTIADALRALRIAAGLIQPTADDLAHGDVAPLVNGVPQPDGKIDIGDVIVILRRSVGLVSW